MARGLGLTALRVALGGLSGVGQDRAAMREAQRVEQEQARLLSERERDRQERAEALRLARELAVRQEQREAVDKGGIMASMDMPGATPRTGVMRQTIGGQEFMFEPESVRERVEKTHAELLRQRREKTLGASMEATGIAPKGMGQTMAAMPPEIRQIASAQYTRSQRSAAAPRAGRSAAPAPTSGAPRGWSPAAEAMGIKQLEKYGRSNMLAEEMQKMLAENPELAAYPGWVTYQLTKDPNNRRLLDEDIKRFAAPAAGRTPAAPGRSAAPPPGRTAAAPPGMAPARPAAAPAATPAKKPINSYWE